MDAETITRKWRDGELDAERLLDLLVEQARTIERPVRTIETFRSELDVDARPLPCVPGMPSAGRLQGSRRHGR